VLIKCKKSISYLKKSAFYGFRKEAIHTSIPFSHHLPLNYLNYLKINSIIRKSSRSRFQLENNLLNPSSETEVNAVDSKLAEMFLDKAILNFRKEQILKEIDRSLEERNKEEFLRLTEKLKNIS
jgi:uncharacterized protein YpiB (UPF0302 family)